MELRIDITSDNCIEIFQNNIKYYRCIRLHDGGIIFEFWRIEKGNTPQDNCKKEMAMLSFNRKRTEFTLHYYPLDGENLLVKTCPIDKLKDAIVDLKNAGF